MNRIWAIIFFLLPLLGLTYTFWRTWQILPLTNGWKLLVLSVMLLCFLMMFSTFGLFNIDHLPMPLARIIYEVGNSSIFVMLYVVMLFLLLDIGRAVGVVPHSFMFHSLKGTLTVLVVIGGLFTYGYFHYMHKHREAVTITSANYSENTPLRIVLLSDLHIGYHNPVGELNRWIDIINKEKPDLILVAGDIIDGRIRPLKEQNMAAAFHRLHAPVIACLGNHEYYTGLDEAIPFYRQAGITLLRDSAITIKGINIIGRDDRTNTARLNVAQLKAGLNPHLFTILLDHQPYHLEEAQHSGIDFQFSGHTHYGQVWPISWITDVIYEDAFGSLQKGNTSYYVSSGLGIWGAKFRIGTRSEYLVLTLKSK